MTRGKITHYQIEGSIVRFIYHRTIPTTCYVVVAHNIFGLIDYIKTAPGAMKMDNKIDIHEFCSELRKGII